jgi:nucleoside-diphosphate-sugar epimerase
MTVAIITGVAGFIGSNLAKRCVEIGWDVHGIDNLSSGQMKFIDDISDKKNFKFYCTKFSDFNAKFYGLKHVDTAFHLAARPRVSYSVEHPVETHDTNVFETLKFLDQFRETDTRIVFASSSSVYGDTKIRPTPESTLRNPKSPYALQKTHVEDYLKLYNELYGLDSVALRFFNVFGPNQIGGSPYSCAVSAWMHAILSGGQCRSDGTGEQTRDLCYVDNVVEACVLASQHLSPLRAEAFNVACGDSASNNDVLSTLKKHFPNMQTVAAPRRPGDVMHTQADIAKIQRAFAYSPKVRVWEGVERTIEWYTQNWDWIQQLKART